MECIYPYVKSTSVFTCPSDAARNAGGSNPYSATQTTASYGMNRFLGWYDGPGVYTWGTGNAACGALGQYYCGDSGYPSSKIQRPTDIIMLSEFGQTANGSNGHALWDFLLRYYTLGGGSADAGVYDNCISGNYMASSSVPVTVSSNHRGFTNIAFVDGHVKAIAIVGDTTAAAVDNTWLMAPCDNGDSSDTNLDTHWHPDK